MVKFLRQLVPHEPRLARKLVQPLTHLIETTPAKSLQFECLYTVACTMATSHPELTALVVTKLDGFVSSNDANLKNLGLAALAKLQQADRQLIEPCRDAVLRCLDDPVPDVRATALSLIAGMVTRATLADLVSKLMKQVSGAVAVPAYRDEVVGVILSAVRTDGFAHVHSFKWLVTTLFALAKLESSHGRDVARLLFEVTLRVPSIRAYTAERSLDVLRQLAVGGADAASGAAGAGAGGGSHANAHGRGGFGGRGGSGRTPSTDTERPSADALLGASYVLGEHSATLAAEAQCAAFDALLGMHVGTLPVEVQSSCIQAALRVATQMPLMVAHTAVVAAGSEPGTPPAAEPERMEALGSLLASCVASFDAFGTAVHPEVAERAREARALLAIAHDLILGLDDGAAAAGPAATGAAAPCADSGALSIGALLDAPLVSCLDATPCVVSAAPSLPSASAARGVALLRAFRGGLGAELRAVAPKAQRKVKPPPGLDLHTPIYVAAESERASLASLWQSPSSTSGGGGGGGRGEHAASTRTVDGAPDEAPSEGGPAEGRARNVPAAAGASSADASGAPSRRAPRRADPYYLPMGPVAARSTPPSAGGAATPQAAARTPEAALSPSAPLSAATPTTDNSPLTPTPQREEAPWVAGGGGGGGASMEFEEDDARAAVVIDLHEEMPAGADQSDEEGGPIADTAAPGGALASQTDDGCKKDVHDAPARQPADPAEASTADQSRGKRRRRKTHRESATGDTAAATLDDPFGGAPLVTYDAC